MENKRPSELELFTSKKGTIAQHRPSDKETVSVELPRICNKGMHRERFGLLLDLSNAFCTLTRT